jgi:molybdopterin-guanine dinucleotide biosynthesis protein B
MPPVVSIVGQSGSGKTTYLEKLIGELTSRGYRIATIKHAAGGISYSDSDKDSGRHIQAGSEVTIVSTPSRAVLVRPVARELSLSELVQMLGEDYDLILTEGFKHGDAPKIEVHRHEVGAPLSEVKKIIARVTDQPQEDNIRQFAFGEVKELADLLESGFIQPQRERLVLYANGTQLTLSTFPAEFIASTLLGMAAALKGVDKVKSLDVFLRRDTEQ